MTTELFVEKADFPFFKSSCDVLNIKIADIKINNIGDTDLVTVDCLNAYELYYLGHMTQLKKRESHLINKF